MTHVCDNCQAETGYRYKVGGYWACEECYVQSQLPPHMRRSQ